MGRLVLGALGCRWGACCCFQVGGRKQGLHEEQEGGRLAEALACVEVEPKPLEDQWGLGGVGEMVREEVGPAEGVGGLEEGHTPGEGALGGGVLMVADQTDQERGLGEEACRHGWEDLLMEGGGPGQEVEDLEGQGGLGGREGGVEGPAGHLCHASSRSCPRAGRD